MPLLLGLEKELEYDPKIREELEQVIAAIQTQFAAQVGKTVKLEAGDIALSGVSAMTWTRSTDTTLTNVLKTRVGPLMGVSFAIQNSTVAGTPSTQLYLRIPDNKMPKVGQIFASVVHLRDNGTTTTGLCYVDRRSVVSASSQNQIVIQRQDSASFSASAGATDVFGQLWFEVE